MEQKTPKKIAILGFAREGKSTLRFLHKEKRLKGADISVLDINKNLKLPNGVRAILGKNYLHDLGQFDIIYRTPAVPYNHPDLVRARKMGAKFSSSTKLFFDNCPATIIGVTGTKGKGTTATLIYRILKTAGKRAHLVGNIGKPSLDILSEIKRGDFVVYELSSFQLQDLAVSPPIAVILDMFPDHLGNVLVADQGAHASLREYLSSKSNIVRFQARSDKTFFLAHNRMTAKVALVGKGKKIKVDEKKFKLFSPKDIKMPGYHNFKNAVVASVVARKLGAPDSVIKKVVAGFPGNEHRLEFVRKIGNITFYNDSASTNPLPTAAAINAFPNKQKILIIGGRDKNFDYEPIAQALKKSRVTHIIILGENRSRILRVIMPILRTSRITFEMTRSLKSAVKNAYAAAWNIKQPSVVIFSPGAKSFDMFKNYADRGQKFKKMVWRLTR